MFSLRDLDSLLINERQILRNKSAERASCTSPQLYWSRDWGLLTVGPSVPNWTRIIRVERKSFDLGIRGVIRTLGVWMVPVWKWWVCRVGQCPTASSTEQDCAALTPVRHPQSQNRGQIFPQSQGWLCHYFLTSPSVLSHGWWSRCWFQVKHEHRTFEVVTVDIFMDLNNVIWNWTKKQRVTSIIVLSAEKLLVTSTPTPLALTRLSGREITEWQSTPFIRGLKHVFILNVFTFQWKRTADNHPDRVIKHSTTLAD